MTDTADMIGQEVYDATRQAALAVLRHLYQQSTGTKIRHKGRREHAHKDNEISDNFEVDKDDMSRETLGLDESADTVTFHAKTVSWDKEGQFISSTLEDNNIPHVVHIISDDMVGFEILKKDVPRTKEVIDTLCDQKIRNMDHTRFPNYRQVFMADEMTSVVIEDKKVAQLVSAALDKAGISHDVLSHKGKYDVLVNPGDIDKQKIDIACDHVRYCKLTNENIDNPIPTNTVKHTPPPKKPYTPVTDKKVAKKTAAALSQNKAVRALKEMRSL